LRAGKRSASVIAVAANGGGIQSAAWAAKVLTEVEIACRKRFPSDPTIFGESVRVISSVSGGSVGAAYFAEAYDPNGAGLPKSPDALSHIVDRAERSSLDEVAWGLVFPDLWRPIIPCFPWKYADRGQALEQALAYEGQGKVRPLLEGLSTWRKSVLDGHRPASIFNATIADTGERLLLATTDMASVGEARKTLAELGKNNAEYADKDIAVVTAARLSASFPYVSPAARSNRPGPQFHVVDGGYYDNYGISSLVEWLDEALRAPDNPIHRVLVLQIRGARAQQNVKLKNRRGWLYQSYAPIATMLHVRTAGQLSHNDAELDLFKRAWLAKGVDVESVVFEFAGDDPPLSWHLTPDDKDEIEKGWAKVLKGTEVTTVTDYLPASPSASAATTGNHHH
jgi:hypothetical protein